MATMPKIVGGFMEGHFLSVEGFIDQRIPQLTVGDSLNAVFTSYNNIGGFSSGPQETGKDGLKIIVQSGGVEPSFITLSLLMSGNLALGNIGAKQMEDRASMGQQIVEEGLKGILPTIDQVDTPFLLVAYAGLSGFEECIEFALSFRKEKPQANIVILTCNCDLRSKRMTLETLLASGEIDDIVVTPRCGGVSTMGEILNALISAWPAKAIA